MTNSAPETGKPNRYHAPQRAGARYSAPPSANDRLLLDPHRPIEYSADTQALLFLSIFLGSALVSNYQTVGVVFLAIPFFYLSRQKLIVASIVLTLLLVKGLFSILLVPDQNYSSYELNYEWAGREILTLFLFWVWFSAGQNEFGIEFFTRQGPTRLWTCVIAAAAIKLYFTEVLFTTIDSMQAIAYLCLFILITHRGFSAYHALAAAIAAVLLASDLSSSFTTIAALGLCTIFVLRLTTFDMRELPWRPIVFVALVGLTFSSLIAEQVYLRSAGEGNNGLVRELLAQKALEIAGDHPFFGTLFGRGIVPLHFVLQLGWNQYFEDVQEYNIYALSFHNGYLYLITRFGVFGIVLLFLLARSFPARGSICCVIFSAIMLLSIAANVVVESLRAGPGVALVLGVLISTAAARQTRVAGAGLPAPAEIPVGRSLHRGDRPRGTLT